MKKPKKDNIEDYEFLCLLITNTNQLDKYLSLARGGSELYLLIERAGDAAQFFDVDGELCTVGRPMLVIDSVALAKKYFADGVDSFFESYVLMPSVNRQQNASVLIKRWVSSLPQTSTLVGYINSGGSFSIQAISFTPKGNIVADLHQYIRSLN